MAETDSRRDPTPEERREIAQQWNAHPGMAHMGATVELLEGNVVRAVIDRLEPHHRGGLGTAAVNGAVIAGLFDLVIGLAGYQHTRGRRAGVAQINVQYLRPVEGARVEVTARPLRVGRNLVFSAAELFDERHVLCARCDGIVSVSGRADAERKEAVL